jgi:hypothetical protein
VIEIRHYVSRAGKDIFDDWLTQLADARAQAKIATSTGLLPETLATASLCDRDYTSCGLIGAQATECITR